MKRLLYLRRFLIVGIAAYWFIFQSSVGFAGDPESNSGENLRPEGASTISQKKDSRWVSYDRQDQTDWLTVVPGNVTDSQLIIRLDFTRVDGPILVEVYGDDPSGAILEQREIQGAEVYEYHTTDLKQHYIKLYATGAGSQAQYEYSYSFAPLPLFTPTATPTITPTPFALSGTPTALASAISTETPLPTPTLVSSPTTAENLAPTDTPIPPTPSAIAAETPIVSPVKAVSVLPPSPPNENPLWWIYSPVAFWGLAGGIIFCLVIVMILLIKYARLKNRIKKPTTRGDLLLSSEYQMLGEMAAERGKLGLAEKCYRKVAEFEPDNLDIRYQIGVFLIQMQQYKEAITEFQKYARGEIIRSEAYVYLAYAYLQIRNLDKSQEYYEKARTLDQNDPNVYVGLGVIAQTRGQYAQAKQHYEHALTLNPRSQEARQNLDQLNML